MIDSEQLVQRFVDQELSGEERVRFVVRLARDESLRQRALELEQLVLDVNRLPRPVVPDGFVASVLERTTPPVPAQPTWRRRWADLFFAPRELRWNLASAVACLALLVVGGVVAARLTLPTLPPGAPASAPGAAGEPAAGAAASSSPVLIRLVVVHPGARTVQVAGDFNGWSPTRTPLEQVSDGAWTVTISLKPGRYEYMFVVDGEQWIADPFAAEQNDDGFGSRNAVLEVRPVETKTGAQS